MASEAVMGKLEPWPLLAALDKLLARENWQEEAAAIEARIADETGIGRVGYRWGDVESCNAVPQDIWADFTWREDHDGSWPPERPHGLPFLRSRDAAAMLEEAVRDKARVEVAVTEDTKYEPSARWDARWFNVVDFSGVICGAKCRSEAAARTSAALEAGHSLGIWPKPRPS